LRKRFFHTPIFHTHSAKKEKKVTWLELFYDLVYVAAFIQLGDAFSENISVDYFFKSAGIFTAMWMSWTGFTYYANRFTVDDILHRVLVFVQMFCVGAMAISIPNLLNGNPVVFGLSYAFSLITISILYLRSVVQQKVGRDYSIYWGGTFLSVSLIWILSLLSEDYYYIGWGVGCCVILLTPMMQKSRDLMEFYPTDLEHLSERYGLLTIIVLGESFVKVLTQLSSINAGAYEILQASFALLLTCSIWWIYFDDVASAHLKNGKNSMVTWLFTHLPLQLSIILMGVGIKKVVSVPIGSVMPLKYAILLGGAIGTALISTALIDSVTYRKNSEVNEATRISIRLFAGVLIIILAVISHSMNNLWFIGGCLFVCLFQVVFDIFFSPYDIDEDEDLELMQEFKAQKVKPISGPIKFGKSVSKEPIRKGLPNDFKKDLYFYFVESSWYQLFIALFFVYILSNVLFAGLYLMSPDSIINATNTFSEAFFFSIQTMSTIGYGTLAPSGFYANMIVTIEAAFGIVSVACVTGLIFAKISKPNAKILFSRNIINSPMNGKNSISFRVSNARGNDIVEASISLSALVDEVSIEGSHITRIKDLKLIRSKSPFFKLSWLVTHIIDEESPLFGIDLSSGKIITIIASLTGHDGVYSNTIYAQKNYNYNDIVKDMYFEDIMFQMPDGRVLIDYDKFNDLKNILT
jgi:inward rectifier potassium channel